MKGGLAFGICGPTFSDMKKNGKSPRNNRNVYAYSLMFFQSAKFDHKAEARGGATNEQAELMAQYEDERDDREEELNELYS